MYGSDGNGAPHLARRLWPLRNEDAAPISVSESSNAGGASSGASTFERLPLSEVASTCRRDKAEAAFLGRGDRDLARKK